MTNTVVTLGHEDGSTIFLLIKLASHSERHGSSFEIWEGQLKVESEKYICFSEIVRVSDGSCVGGHQKHIN